MFKNLFSIIFMMILACQSVLATPFNANAKTKRIPAGTELTLKMLNPVNTAINTQGTNFSATLLSDKAIGDEVILPLGSIVRGDILAIMPPKRLSKGAILYLNFDHVVTPNGRQIPLSLAVTGRADMTFDGGITTTKGYKDAWLKTCKKSGELTTNAISWGEEVVNDSGWKYVTVPISAFGGALGTAGYFVYGSVADLIKKGEHVNIQSGEIINVILVNPIDVPVI